MRDTTALIALDSKDRRALLRAATKVETENRETKEVRLARARAALAKALANLAKTQKR